MVMAQTGSLVPTRTTAPNTLANGVTIGNPQAQQDYTSQLARALADMQSA